VIEVGNILYTPAMQRTPAGTDAMYLMARHVFEDLGYRRYEWKCNTLNAPSRRAAERYGFTFEGIFRNHMIVKGRNRDTAWYAMLASEWPARKTAFERWLAAENFDATGRQRMSLSGLMSHEITIEQPPFKLRRATTDDLGALIALQQAAYAANREILGVEPIPLLTDYAAILSRYEVWIAGGDAIEAALILDPQPGHLLIWSLATAAGRQGEGVGGALIAAAEARANNLGLTTVRLYTGEKLTRQVRWYHRHGYTIERVEELDDRRLVHMIKTTR
jgi:ribosomal protein S18 acetylase RimI-like enzyme